MSKKICIEKRDRSVLVTINRPEVMNAIDNESLDALLEIFDVLSRDQETYVVVLKGAGGRSFCSGIDLKDNFTGSEAQKDVKRKLFMLYDLMYSFDKPILCQVQGFAIGAGCGIAALADIVVGSSDAIFSIPEIKMGFFPSGLVAPLVRTVGAKKMIDLALTGRRVDANEALALGLLNRIVPKNENLEDFTLNLAADISKMDIEAIRFGKRFVLTLLGGDFYKNLRMSELKFFE